MRSVGGEVAPSAPHLFVPRVRQPAQNCATQKKVEAKKLQMLAAGESVFMDYEKKKEVGEKAGKGE